MAVPASLSLPPGIAMPQAAPTPAVPCINLKAILETYIVEDPVETLFHGCVKRVLIPDRGSQPELLETLRNLFTTSSQEILPHYMDQYVLFISVQSNHQRVVYLLNQLSTLVSTGILKSRLVCETLLRHLDVSSNEMVWSESLKVLRRIVGGVDYKGCRDLMKLLFEKFDHLPRHIPEQQLSALLQGQELLAYILDRNASLLPAYFAHDEIQRHYPDKNRPPHWILQEVISKLRSSMQATADMVSGIVQQHLQPVLGVSNVTGSVWRLDSLKHCCALKGLLPYREALLKPQEDLLFHVIAQPNSRDVVHAMLGMNRQQLQPSVMVEDALVRLGVVAMELSEKLSSADDQRLFEVWSHFASQLVFFYFLQLVNVTNLLNKLRNKLSRGRYQKGRRWLMWCFLHFLTSTIPSKAAQSSEVTQKELVPVLNLFFLLYQDKEPLAVPDISKPSCIYETAMASVWLVYTSKIEEADLPRPMPFALSTQIEWIRSRATSLPSSSSLTSDCTVPLLLNVFSNNLEISGKLLNILLEGMLPHGPDAMPSPLPLHALNTLTMHAKIRLMDRVKLHLVKVAEAAKQPPGPDTPTITHALLETYSRLLVWLGTRNFQTHLIPAVFKSQAWGVLHALLELISHRVHLQLQYSYRFQLLQQLHTVASVSIIPNQLLVTAESATLRVVRGLNSPEFLIQLAKQFANDPKPLLSAESEELNRVFVLVLAQAMHVSNMDTVNWLDPFLRAVFSTAPQTWPETTISFFPLPLRQLCSPPNLTQYKATLISKVEEEYRKFKSKSNETELIQLFTDTDSTAVFLCILWKLLLETGSITPICIKISQLIAAQPKKLKLSVLMRKLVDYIVFTLPAHSESSTHLQLNTVVLRLNELIWKYNFFPLDRLILCMVMRGYVGKDATMCLTVVCSLLLGTQELTQRIATLVQEVPADHWSQPGWDIKHTSFLKQYLERFEPEAPGLGLPSKTATLPMYFGNVCLRFLPVLDLVIQRTLEVPEVASKYLEKLLDSLQMLYKYHDHPLSYLYSTLHYYERTLTERPALKRKLVSTTLGAQLDVNPLERYFTAEFCAHIATSCSPSSTPSPSRSHGNGETWTPSQQYYSNVIAKLVKGLQPFSTSVPSFDWHFSEFSGPLAFTLHCTLVEILSLPQPGPSVAKELLETVYNKAASSTKESEEREILAWINAVGLIFILLPETYRSPLLEAVLQTLQDSHSFPHPSLHHLVGENRPGCLLSVVHAYWHHANMGVLLSLPQWLQTSVRPVVTNEYQLLYVCHLVGPLLQRLTHEKPKVLLDVVMEVYLLLQAVDQHQGGRMDHSDILCDFLYHIKYMHIGDKMREEIEKVVSSLHTPLKMRLRFLVPSPPASGQGGLTPMGGVAMPLQPPAPEHMQL